MDVSLNLQICGWILILLGIMPAGFPSYFNWAEELEPLSLMNRQLVKMHNLFIAVGLPLMGLICLTSAEEIASTRLGQRLAMAGAVFWILRLIVQFAAYPAELWRGRRFETLAHVGFTMVWIYLAGVFAWAALAFGS